MTTLKAEKRSMDVKAKRLRREGYVTGNVFGKKIQGSIPVKMEKKDVDRLLKTETKGGQIMLDVEGEVYDVLIKEVDYAAMANQVVEIDFQALVSNEKVHSVAEIIFENHDKVETGVLQEVLKEVSYRALPAALVEKVKVDVGEMEIGDCEEDEEHASECVCGKENLRYLFTIRNRETGRSLYPIGSSCIEKFERDDLDYEVDVQMDMYRLAHAMERGERIELTSKYFSKKLLYALYEEGAFAPNKYNRYDGTNDYQFMLDMFNKRNKSEITEQQHRKIRGLIAYSIKPFLRERLKYK